MIDEAASSKARVPVRWRAAVIGCGWIGSEVADDPRADGVQAHAAAYASCSSTQLVGVCDTDPARAERAARRWGLAVGACNAGRMLADARPHIVSICTPDATHAALLREVLEYPHVRAVVVEKPLALDVGEARALVDRARSRDVRLVVNYSRRFAQSHIEAQRRIASGVIGNVCAVSGTYNKGILHNGSHWFDLARWMVGEITQIEAWPGPTDDRDRDPTCHARMSFAGGQTGVLLGLDAERYTTFEMDLMGTQGRLRIVDSGLKLEWFAVGESARYSGYRVLEPAGQTVTGFRDVALAMVENVVAALRDGTALRCSGTDGVAALAIAAAARRSLALGTVCTVE